MAFEIERKYLVDHGKWAKVNKPDGRLIRQGYLIMTDNKTIRVRITGDNAFLTIKGKTIGLSRAEFEYKIPVQDAEELLNTLSLSELSKTRYEIHYEEKLWEVDIFHDLNEGLIVAEIELSDEDEKFGLPDWVADEVTDDPKYYNSNLTITPFKNWK